MTDSSRTALLGRIGAVYDGEAGSSSTLSRLCLDLVETQRHTWPTLNQAYNSLEEIVERKIQCTRFSVLVQHNPGRITSTFAHVNNGSTDGRPCFLCPKNLPAEQQAILYCDRYFLLPNPMPVLPFHFTVAFIHHEPQAISGRIDAFLKLTADLGPDWAVLYNGPKCGASAPDHFHFQIIPSGRLPIEKEIMNLRPSSASALTENVLFYLPDSLGRQAVVLEGTDAHALGRAFHSFLDGLRNTLKEVEEPMINIVGFLQAKRLCLVVFPRRKHRPDAFFKSGEEQISISPAVVEMGGILVTPLRRDFERLDKNLVEAIFEEVSMERGQVERALESIKMGPDK